MIRACVFAKPPLPGRVKTRLAVTIGEAGAAELASAMLCDVWRTVTSMPGVAPVLATTELGEFPIELDAKDVWLQGDGDLGERLERVFVRALTDAHGALAIGADTPLLQRAHLEDAAEVLERHDAVMGRTLDGGFYLLGLRRCPVGLFSDIPWSTPHTASAMIDRLRENRVTVGEIEALFDVDVPDDLAVLKQALLSDSNVAPNTRRCVSALSFRR